VNLRSTTIAICALASAAASINVASGAAATRLVPASALSSRTVRVGTATGVLILPRHPRTLAIVIHGGEIAWNPTRATLGTSSAARVYARRLAPLGIGVLSVGYRWSGYGGGELRDVEASLAWSAKAPLVAHLPKILVGASHGGYLAALAATTSSARSAGVRAVVDLYGFSDLGATVTGPGSRWDRQARLTLRELGPPQRAQAAYAARSPLFRASLFAAPLLQIVGSRDRTTQPDVLALARAVRLHGNHAVTQVIPGSNHGLAFGTPASSLVWRDVGSFLRGLRLAN
jgi:dipeptidyl aminopeptidase/acylaminoacyl peptidase